MTARAAATRPLVDPRILLRMLGYGAGLLLAYAGGVGFVFLFVASPSLVDIVSACKVVSLLVLLYANREIPKNIELERHGDIAALNLAIIVASSLLLLLMVVKIVVDDYAALDMPPKGQAVLAWFTANAHWLSTLPIFAYCLLDLHIALIRRGETEDRRVALEFVVFRDMVCAAPLALVLALTEVYATRSALPGARADAELFFGGALAVILLASAIATKALNVVQTARVQAGADAAPPVA